MDADIVSALSGLDGVTLFPGLSNETLALLRDNLPFGLPEDYWRLLGQTNGAEAYHGYIRMFGFGAADRIDANRWNGHEEWKFAWTDLKVNYWCFAETAFGDQYAYRVDDVAEGVYWLDGLSLSGTVVAPDFSTFLETEFLRTAKEPYDALMPQALAKLGALSPTENVIHAPSVLLTGVEDVANVMRSDARTAMIIHGDIASQWNRTPDHAEVTSVEPYADSQGRPRMRLNWR